MYQKQDAQTNNNNYKLDLSKYSTGVYFLNLETETSKITKKLIVN